MVMNTGLSILRSFFWNSIYQKRDPNKKKKEKSKDKEFRDLSLNPVVEQKINQKKGKHSETSSSDEEDQCKPNRDGSMEISYENPQARNTSKLKKT
jgi:hypothetical protein